MDSSAHNLPGVFRELSRLSVGDHAIYLRTDSHNFFEIHRSGARNLFTSTVAAFIPNVVIKLQTPLVPSIIAAVPSQQGSPILHTRSRLFIVEGLSDIVNLVKHHTAAFIREDATLAVWADEVQPALAALHRVLKDLGVSLGRHDLVRVADPSGINSEDITDSGADRDAFDEFIHNYDDPIDKIHDEPAFLDLEAMYPVSRTNLFDSLSSDSLMLGDSPFLASTVSSDMSHLSLDSTPQAYTFSSLAFHFSPSVSGSSSDSSALSTPLTIAPSVLSSPLSTWNSPQLPTISESYTEGTLQDALPLDSMELPPASPPGSDEELTADSPSKRKRSSKGKHAQPAGGAVPEKTRSRRAAHVAPSPKAAASPSPRARKTVSKAIAPAPPRASKRAVCPLPRRTGRSRSSSTSSSSSAGSSPSASRTSATSVSKTRGSPVAQLTIPRVTHAAYCESESDNEHEILESDDSGSEYEADPSELELDELDNECDNDYRPAKRAWSLSSSILAPPPDSSDTVPSVRRKAVSPKIASEKKASKKRKSSARSAGASKKKKAKAKAKAKGAAEGPAPTCVWCDKEFTRESDVQRHERYSCELYPFDRAFDSCPLCDKEISRTDAVIRHQGSDDCKKRQRELREQGLLKVAKTKAGARVAKAVKAPLSPRRRTSRTLSS
ncbi:hypothetical protein LXA43DRAFT_23017 [Ganoderma leucocontextum]|nr:hypothetical protein LXA43DRAFT_23017 [Ganoderma leucocontextum]